MKIASTTARLAVLLLSAALCAPAQAAEESVLMQVQDGACAAPPDAELAKAGSRQTWLAEGVLQVEYWANLNSYSHVVENSATVDDSEAGSLVFKVDVEHVPPAKGEPVVTCIDWVKLTFVLFDMSKLDYKIAVRSRPPAIAAPAAPATNKD